MKKDELEGVVERLRDETRFLSGCMGEAVYNGEDAVSELSDKINKAISAISFLMGENKRLISEMEDIESAQAEKYGP